MSVRVARHCVFLGILFAAGCGQPDARPDRPMSPMDLTESKVFAERATEALGQGDVAGYEANMDSAVTRRPHQPVFVFHAGRSKLAAGDTTAAGEWFTRLVAMGMTRSVVGDGVVAGASTAPWYPAFIDGLEANAAPTGATRLVGSMGTDDMVPESVAYDPQGGRWFVGGVRSGTIVEASVRGERVLAAGLPSVMGMVWDAGRLVVAVSQTPHLAGPSDMDTGVLILDATDGSVLAHHAAPDQPEAPPAWVGDVHVAPDGSIYATDSVRNVMYRVPVDGGALQVAVESPWFNSLQGMAQMDGDPALYVADYTAGILRVDLENGGVARIPTPPDATLLGIDGLDGYGRSLLGIQNGTQPQRVVQIVFDPDGSHVARVDVLAANIPEFAEPTLGVMADSDYVFVANSYWPHLNEASDLDPSRERERPTLLAVTPARF